jgi:hypothetical protein
MCMYVRAAGDDEAGGWRIALPARYSIQGQGAAGGFTSTKTLAD